MSFINNIKIKSKLILMLIFPIAGLMYFSVNGIWEKSILSSNMRAVESLSSLAVKISALVHELQKERGASAVFLGRKGTEFVSELSGQRHETDKKLTDLQIFLKGFDASRFGAEFKGNMDTALTDIDAIKGKREAIDRLRISGGEARNYFANTISSSLDIVAAISRLSSNTEITIMTSAYVNFLLAKERVGKERALMSSTFAMDRFEPGMFNDFVSFVAEQNAYINVFLYFASSGQKDFYKTKMQGQFVDESARMRKIAFEKGDKGGFGVDAGHWYRMITGKINLLKEVEDRLSNDLHFKAKQLESNTQFALIVFALLTVIVVILAVIFAFLVVRGITQPLNKIVEASQRIVSGDLHVNTDINSRDEIGILANAFNSMVKHVEERTETIKTANEELFKKKQEMEILNEELVKANKTKSQFLANVSHELRTPLNSIMGFSELLSEKSFGELNEKQTQYVNYINTSGSHLLHLINNILDLSKIEAGKFELEPEEFPLADVIGEVLSIIRPMAYKKAVVVESKTTPLSPTVRLDREKFKQIMLNLLSNAVKFNKSGGRVSIDWDISEEAKGDIMERILHISVKDTGIGIKDEDIPKIFREFEQLDSSITREYGGTGLGMALTKKLVELHGGRIWVESEYGKDTTFNLVIPQGVSGLQPAYTKDMSVVKRLTYEPPSLILVASESADTNELIKVYLEENDYCVELCADGCEVLKKAALLKPFAVILGIMLPKKDGWEILRELKASHDTCEIPVIIVSAANNKELGFSLGAVDYLAKPVDKDKLLHTLGKLSFIAKGKRHPFSILAIDDEPQVLQLLGDILEKEGFDVIKAAGGEEGIALAIEKDPDLIILDLMMPHVSGFDVVEQLKIHPTAKDIPVVIFTVKDVTEIDKAKLGHNIANILGKADFSKKGLLNEIKKLEMAYPARARMIDPLTGVFNNRYFNHWIVQEIERSKRYGLQFTVLLIDVDRLHNYNTRNGFLLGNEALIDLAGLIKDNIRKADCLIRYGGDEFLVVLPNIKQEAAAVVAEKLRVSVENHPFPSADGKKAERLTISIGLAGFPADGKESNELMSNVSHAAKSAFQYASLSGGNKVSIFRKAQ